MLRMKQRQGMAPENGKHTTRPLTSEVGVSQLDTIFLHVESDRTPMHMTSVALFEAGPLLDAQGDLRVEELRQLISSRLHHVPKLRQLPRHGLLFEAPPVWSDDPAFDISNHVTLRRVAAPGSNRELTELCADIVSEPLLPDQPLWEMIFVEGLASGEIAVVEKLHHSMADGIAAAELATVLLDPSPDSHTNSEPVAWEPRPRTPLLNTAGRDVARLAAIGLRLAAWAGWTAIHPARRSRAWAMKGAAAIGLFRGGPLAPRSPLNHQIGPDRSIHFARFDLDEVRTVARARGCTVNDVVLTMVAHGLHKLLTKRDALDSQTQIQVLVPVGLDIGPDRALGNRISALLVRVALGTDDVVASLAQISAQTKSRREQHQELLGATALSLLEPIPQSALVPLSWLIGHQPFFNLIVTNVPGPDVPLYLLGARMTAAYPIVPLVGNQGLGVAALSYMEQLTLGVLADPHVCPDADILCEGAAEALGELRHNIPAPAV